MLQQLWGIEVRQRPGPKPAFHISDIGRAAIKLADTGGLAAVSMSKVAAELGFTTMSLYRYVDAKDDLYVVMLEHAFGTPPDLDAHTGWRDRITAWAEAFRDGLRQHPWILQIPVFEPPLSPNQLTWMESALHAFDGTPLSPQDRLSSMLLVNIYVRGTAQLTAHMDTEPGRGARGRPALHPATGDARHPGPLPGDRGHPRATTTRGLRRRLRRRRVQLRPEHRPGRHPVPDRPPKPLTNTSV